MTTEEFKQWWLFEHRPLASKLPRLRRGVFNLVTEPNGIDVDGVSELWFDNESDFEAAYASPIGKKVAEDSLENVDRRQRLLVLEKEV